ncbi:MAG: hypothetical protein ACRDYC_11200, partial [Acidimicrobiales bacterium]
MRTQPRAWRTWTRSCGAVHDALCAGLDSMGLRGHLEVYAERGTVQLRVTDIDPRVAVGDQELARRAARDSLARAGLLHAQGALRLAAPPLRVS